MTPMELKAYFDNNPLPNEIQWKEWSKIMDTKKFIDNAFMCINLFKGNYINCPDYWHLLEFYNDIQAGKIPSL
ncbi:hypothetical protein KXS00_13790 [Olivibacter jilunii]